MEEYLFSTRDCHKCTCDTLFSVLCIIIIDSGDYPLGRVHNMTQGLALRCVKVVTSENIEFPAKFLRSDA